MFNLFSSREIIFRDIVKLGFTPCIHCTARQCSSLRRTFMECSIINPALSLLMKHLVIGQRQKAPNFSDLHWSPYGSQVSIDQHFVTTRVVHLPKRTETSLITESDQSGHNHQLLQLCKVRTAWSDSDQAVRALQSCSSWLFFLFLSKQRLWVPVRTASMSTI